MARVDVNENDVAGAFITALQSALSLGNSHCYESLDPLDIIVPQGGDFWLSVFYAGGVFNPEHQAGGGAVVLTEDARVVVTIYTKVRLDRADHDDKIMRISTRGLGAIKKRVLNALVGIDLTTGSSTFLRDLISAAEASQAQYDREKYVGYMQLTFNVAWDWAAS